jgi:hypothetical protein
MASLELESEKKKNSRLEKELAEIKSQSKNPQETKEKKDTSSFLDKLKDYMPLILAGAGILGACLLNKKRDKPELPPSLQGLAKIFENIDDNQQAAIGKFLIELAKNPPEKENSTGLQKG